MGSFLCCCFEPYDDWSIDSEVRHGEKGAGYLYKRGKGAAVWSKRYFTIADTKLVYYTEQDRAVARGEIVLVGSSAKISASRASTRNEYYFTITHPECGTRELYAKSNNRRMQWITRLNDISAQLSKTACYGKLLKQGGMSKNIWQERWCVLAGRVLDYFENPSDSQVKGSIDIWKAKIREFSQKDQKFCFEISSAYPGKKGMKKYVFAVSNQAEYDKWLITLKKNSTITDVELTKEKAETSKTSINPMQTSREEDEDEDDNNAGSGNSNNNNDGSSSNGSSKSLPAVSTTAKEVELSRSSSQSSIKAPEIIARPSDASIRASSDVVRSSDVIRASDPARASETLRASSTDASRSFQSPKLSESSISQLQPLSSSPSPSISSFTSSFSRPPTSTPPPEKKGYLEKLSPARFAGWQKRYFTLIAPGILLYYGSESDAGGFGKPKGDIQMSDILPGSMGVKLVEEKNEIIIQLEGRTFNLRAENATSAQEWVKAIKKWIAYVNGDD